MAVIRSAKRRVGWTSKEILDLRSTTCCCWGGSWSMFSSSVSVRYANLLRKWGIFRGNFHSPPLALLLHPPKYEWCNNQQDIPLLYSPFMHLPMIMIFMWSLLVIIPMQDMHHASWKAGGSVGASLPAVYIPKTQRWCNNQKKYCTSGSSTMWIHIEWVFLLSLPAIYLAHRSYPCCNTSAADQKGRLKDMQTYNTPINESTVLAGTSPVQTNEQCLLHA